MACQYFLHATMSDDKRDDSSVEEEFPLRTECEWCDAGDVPAVCSRDDRLAQGVG